ncbi:phosphohistidine phosphatase SixA [Denitratisoma sp. agr-D3]
MELILWRHAQAEDPLPDQDDLARALTGKGRKQAKAMARWLHARLPADTRILVSPALRTRQTADALKLPYTVIPALAPDAAPAALLHAAGWPAHPEPVLIVGHQPTLGLLAARLLCGREQPWSVKKGAVWWLRAEGNGASLVSALSAEQL